MENENILTAVPSVSNNNDKRISLSFDINEIKSQIEQIKSLLNNIPENLREQFFNQAINLSSNVILGKNVMTIGADGTYNIIIPLRIGDGFVEFCSALRAIERKDGEIRHK